MQTKNKTKRGVTQESIRECVTNKNMKNNNIVNAAANNITSASIMDALRNESMGRVYHITPIGRKSNLADAVGLYDQVYTKDEAEKNANAFGITYKLTETGSDLLKLIRKGIGITHGGIFHADDIFATALLRMINPNFKVRRMFNVPENVDALVYDIGRGKYDHHEKDEEKERRENGVPYAAFGKLWRDIAPEIFGEDIYRIVDISLVQGIDAVDNGVKDAHNEISGLIHDFNPMWNETWTTQEAQFQKAVELAYQILWRKIQGAMSTLDAKDKVQKALDSRVGDKKIMVLNEYVPYYDYINDAKELLYVVYPSIRGGWNVQTVPTVPGGRTAKLDVPESWKGFDRNNVKEYALECAPLDGMSFCHATGFVTAFDTKDQAIWAAMWLCGDRKHIVRCFSSCLCYEYDPCSGMRMWVDNYCSEQQLLGILLKAGYTAESDGKWASPDDPYENKCDYEIIDADEGFRLALGIR